MIEVIPSGKALGAEIRGADLSRGLGPADVRTMLDAWSQHLVLLFRDQFISDPELIGLSRSFGDLDLCPPNATGKQYSAEHPELIIVSNVVVDGEPEFCNMYAATADLPGRLRAAVEGKWARQDGTYDSAGAPQRAVEVVGVRTESPHARHPLMRRHPDTARTVLYLGRRPKQYVVGLDPEDSEELLDALWAHSTQRKYVWTHEWRVGDLIVWDNRCVMHRRNAFPAHSRRTMHRTQVTGSAIVAA